MLLVVGAWNSLIGQHLSYRDISGMADNWVRKEAKATSSSYMLSSSSPPILSCPIHSTDSISNDVNPWKKHGDNDLRFFMGS